MMESTHGNTHGASLAPPGHFLQKIHHLDYSEVVLKNIYKMRMGYLADRFVVVVRMLCPNSIRKASVVAEKNSKDGTYILSAARWFARYTEGIRTGEYNPRIEGVAQAMRLLLASSDVMMALSILSEEDRKVCIGEHLVAHLRRLCKDNTLEDSSMASCDTVDDELKKCLEMLPGFRSSFATEHELLAAYPGFQLPLSVSRYVIKQYCLQVCHLHLRTLISELMGGYFIWQNSQIGFNTLNRRSSDSSGSTSVSEDFLAPSKLKRPSGGTGMMPHSSFTTEGGSTCTSNPGDRESRSTTEDDFSEGESTLKALDYQRERSWTSDTLELGDKPAVSDDMLCFLNDYYSNIVKDSETLNISSLMRRFGLSMGNLIPKSMVENVSALIPHSDRRSVSNTGKTNIAFASGTDPHNFVQKFKKLGCSFGWLSERVLTGGKVDSARITAGLRAVLSCPDVMVALAALPSEQRSYVLSNAYMYIVNVNHGDSTGVGITAMTPVPADVQFSLKTVDTGLFRATMKIPGVDSVMNVHEEICQKNRRFHEAIALTRFAVRDFYHTRCPNALEQLSSKLCEWLCEHKGTACDDESLSESMSCPDTSRHHWPSLDYDDVETVNTVAGELSTSQGQLATDDDAPRQASLRSHEYISPTLYSPEVLRRIDSMSISDLVTRYSDTLPRLTAKFQDKINLTEGETAVRPSAAQSEHSFVGRWRKLAHSFGWLSTGVKNGNIDSKLIKKAMRVLLCAPDIMYCLAVLDDEHREYAISNAYVRIISVNYGDPSGVDKAQRLTPLPPNCLSITSVYGKASCEGQESLIQPCLDHILYAIPSTRSAMIKAMQVAQSTPRFDEALAITRFSISEFMKSRQPEAVTNLCDALCTELKFDVTAPGSSAECDFQYGVERLTNAEESCSTECNGRVSMNFEMLEKLRTDVMEMDANGLARHFDYVMDNLGRCYQSAGSNEYTDVADHSSGKGKSWWDTAVHVKYRLWSDASFRGLAHALVRKHLGSREGGVPETILAGSMREILSSTDVVICLSTLPVHWRCRAMDRAASQLLAEVDSRGSRLLSLVNPTASIDNRMSKILNEVGLLESYPSSGLWKAALNTLRGILKSFFEKHAPQTRILVLEELQRKYGNPVSLDEYPVKDYLSEEAAENVAVNVTETVLSPITGGLSVSSSSERLPQGYDDRPFWNTGEDGYEGAYLFQSDTDPITESFLTTIDESYTCDRTTPANAAPSSLEYSQMSTLGATFHKDVSFHSLLRAETLAVQNTEASTLM
eukprot:gb/GECG01011992.1/.p1 GENE.gb/GECG01011992.1/~~gb/GECG01011992.1/.p1  ORF type:complete len:1268 (+),score=145.36 gb/GECG01011992.1/:1-3804(+)